MVDLDRVSDLELLRTVAKVQDAEIRRLSKQLLLVTRELAAANKEDSATIQKRLIALEKELQEVQERAYGHQSERLLPPASPGTTSTGVTGGHLTHLVILPRSFASAGAP